MIFSSQFKKVSFSQCGEDCIIDFMFKHKQVEKPGYIDIGAFHPFELSNTAKFYLKGSRGINIEPNPDQFKYFIKYRRKDKNLNIGIGSQSGQFLYYKMSTATLNTFDKDVADDMVKKHGIKIVEKIQLPVTDLRSVIEKYSENKFPDFLSLDAEGLDEQILQQIDFDTNYPKIICVETIEYTNDATGKKDRKIINFLLEKGYILYADTFINSIFVSRKFW